MQVQHSCLTHGCPILRRAQAARGGLESERRGCYWRCWRMASCMASAKKSTCAPSIISMQKRQPPAPPQGGVKVVCLLLFTCSSVASCRQVHQAVQWSERTHCLQPADEIPYAVEEKNGETCSHPNE
jgi:hypothetical protein